MKGREGGGGGGGVKPNPPSPSSSEKTTLKKPSRNRVNNDVNFILFRNAWEKTNLIKLRSLGAIH